MSISKVKMVVVGDVVVGKTCLVMSFSQGTFSEESTPTVLENVSVHMNVKGVDYLIELHEVGGAEAYERLRPVAYPQTDVFLICCSVAKPSSFANANKLWKREINHYCPGIPFILVGTQIDWRDNVKMTKESVTREEGEELAQKMGAIKYIECSAKTHFNIKTLFEDTLITALTKPINVKKQCILL